MHPRHHEVGGLNNRIGCHRWTRNGARLSPGGSTRDTRNLSGGVHRCCIAHNRHGRRVAVSGIPLIAHNLAGRELDNALLHAINEVGRVRSHHHRRTARVDGFEQRHDSRTRGRVQVTRGLVSEKKGRLVHDGASNGNALLLATRQFVRIARRLSGEPHHLEYIRNGRLDVALGLANHLERESHVFINGLVGKKTEVLENNAKAATKERNLATGDDSEVLTQHVNDATGRFVLFNDQPQARRFARSGGAHQKHKLTSKDFEAHVVECRARRAAVLLGDIVKTNHADFEPRQATPRRRRATPASWVSTFAG